MGNNALGHQFKSTKLNSSYVRIIFVVRVSAIVPVFNEEKTVTKVVETLLQSSTINEVICVYDRSSDRSLDVLKSFGERIELIVHRKRMGKGLALAVGVKAAEGEIVAFFDADLLTLTEEHIHNLISPLIEGQTRASLGYSTKDQPVERFKHIKIPMFGNSLSYQVGHKFPYLVSPGLTGERAFFKEDLLPYLDEMSAAKFGVEILFNKQFKDVTPVVLPGLTGVLKFEKFSFREAIQQYIEEGVELAQEIGRQERDRLQDFKVLEKIRKTKVRVVADRVVDFSLLQERIAKIKNKQVRKFLSEYFSSYLTKAASRFKNKL